VTLIMWVIFVSCFILLAIMKTHGTMLWASVTGIVLLAGFLMAQKRAPEKKEIEKGDHEMQVILYMAQSSSPDLHLVFRRSYETAMHAAEDNVSYITFFSPRAGIPPKLAPNHFRIPLIKFSLYHRLVGLLRVVEYEFPDRKIIVHLGWPLSSWLDRFAIGVMVFNMMRLPRLFPHFQFIMSYTEHAPPGIPAPSK
jgi:hypothetical protein